MFCSLLGDKRDGYWSLAPSGFIRSTRSYVDDTLVLGTRFETSTGVATICDFMPLKSKVTGNTIVRLVRGEAGRLSMHNGRR